MRVTQMQVDYLALQLAAIYQDAMAYAERLALWDLAENERALLVLEHRRRTVDRALEALHSRLEFDIAGDEPR